MRPRAPRLAGGRGTDEEILDFRLRLRTGRRASRPAAHLSPIDSSRRPLRPAPPWQLLNLTVVNAGLEAETYWQGLQLIAIYGRKRGNRKQPAADLLPRRRPGSLAFDLRGVEPKIIPALLAGLTELSREKRQFLRDE